MNKETKDLLSEIRQAFADFYVSKGCGCCCDREAQKEAEDRLGKLLKVPMFEDKSGYDFWKFRTKK